MTLSVQFEAVCLSDCRLACCCGPRDLPFVCVTVVLLVVVGRVFLLSV